MSVLPASARVTQLNITNPPASLDQSEATLTVRENYGDRPQWFRLRIRRAPPPSRSIAALLRAAAFRSIGLHVRHFREEYMSAKDKFRIQTPLPSRAQCSAGAPAEPSVATIVIGSPTSVA
jgi:hypothetical protein